MGDLHIREDWSAYTCICKQAIITYPKILHTYFSLNYYITVVVFRYLFINPSTSSSSGSGSDSTSSDSGSDSGSDSISSGSDSISSGGDSISSGSDRISSGSDSGSSWSAVAVAAFEFGVEQAGQLLVSAWMVVVLPGYVVDQRWVRASVSWDS